MVKYFAKAVFVLLLFTGEVLGQFQDGSGSKSDPYQISTLQQLQNIQGYSDAYFVQVNDINAAESQSWNEGKGFQPIPKFTGSYDGQDFTITGIHIDRPEQDYAAVFAYVDGGIIKNLNIEKANISGADNSGILAGFSINGRIENVHIDGRLHGLTHTGGLIGFNYGRIMNSSVSATVSGHSYTGGLVGFNRGRIDSSYTEGSVSGSGNGIGGLVGNNYDGNVMASSSSAEVVGSNATSFGGLVGSNGGSISKVFATGDIYGRSYVGGLVGFNRGDISQAYATGNVKGSRNGVGGLIGNNYEGRVSYVYSTGKVEGITQVGGLIGVNRTNALIKEAYTISEVKGQNDVGGLIGLNDALVSSGYWNPEVNDHLNAVGRGFTEEITALSEEEMTGFDVNQHMSGFSFNSIWGAIEYENPKLLWNRPYYIIGDIEGRSSIVSGEVLDLQVEVKNIGGVADTNQVVLRNQDGKIIHTAENLILDNNESMILEFEWKSSVTDHGEREFVLQSNQDQEVIQFAVRMIPDKVEIEEPANLDESVPIKPEFKWEEAYLGEKYHLQIATDIKFEHIIYDKDEISALTFKLSKPLEFLENYYWRVRAKNEEETGAWSDVFNFITIIEKPETVQLPEVEEEKDIVSTLPTFRWSSSGRAERYILQLSKVDDFEEIAFDSTFKAQDTLYTVKKELQNETEYYWRVQAENAGGKSNWSETGSIFTNRNLLKKDESKPVNFTLKQNYPNPFNSTTNIEFGLPESSYVLLEVLNMLGQNVATLVNEPKSAGWHSVTFDASGLSSGFYLYRLKTKSFEQIRKLMLIK